MDNHQVDRLIIANSIGDTYNIVSEHDIDMIVKERVDQILRDRETEQESKRMTQIGELLSMIAHQWRQPLTSISIATMSGRTKLELDIFDLGDRAEVEECKNKIIDNYRKIDRFVQNLSHTIDNFKDFFKPSRESKIVNPNLLIARVLQITEDSLRSDRIKIIKDLKCTKSVEVYDSELMQVILNILKNSQDCFRDKKSINSPYIHIESIDTTQGINVIITDNGGGISTNTIERIFDPYFSTKSYTIGTGLGLSISKTIIEQHHKGTIRADNTHDGATFIIELKDSIHQ